MHRMYLVISALLLASISLLAQQPSSYDLVIRNGRIIDGSGNPWYRADIAIAGNTIVAISNPIDVPARRIIDAAGMVVSPGFIDIHTHARRGIFQVPTADNYVRQGVTTIFEGPDGGSPIPLKPFLDKIAGTKITPNFGMFVGQGSVRTEVIGDVNRKATAAEIDRMKDLVRLGMHDGAFGLSTGLFYVPGTFTPVEEIIELAKVAGAMGGIHISHMRDEAANVVESVRETIRIGEEGHLPTQVTHHKIIGKAYWGKSIETLKLLDEARARGVDATIDQYPYTASSTSVMSALWPSWAQEGGRNQVLARIKNAGDRAKIKAACVSLLKNERGGGDPKNVVISACPWDPSLAGKNLAEVTRFRGMPVTLENAAEAVFWIVEQGGCQGIFHAISEDDLIRILKHPATMIASDGEVPVFGQSNPHPRSYGTFARVLGLYARERGVLNLEDAVRKMSSAPAQRVGLRDRGMLRPGMKADITIFDPRSVRDRATFDQPHQYAEGFMYVIINGQMAFELGRMTSARPGQVLYGPAYGR
jgi:N-acyl-D-amino-acid deacylase